MEEKNKYIFLDFDGVLNTGNYYRYLQMNGKSTTDKYGVLFDTSCVNLINNVIDTTKAKIIVISSWRFFWSIGQLKEMWTNRGLNGELQDITPTNLILSPKEVHTKGIEIRTWFNSKNLEQQHTSYVIIDDENLFLDSQQSHLILTRPDTGITKEIAEQIVKILQ